MKNGEIARYLGALGVGGALARFGMDNQEALASLPWQGMMPYVDGAFSLYGAGETLNAWSELAEMRERGERPHFLEYVGKAMRSSPAFAYPVGALSGRNPLYSAVLPGMVCVAGYIIDSCGKSLRERKKGTHQGHD